MSTKNSTIVIGGGLLGVCTFYTLCKRGQPAILVEAHDELGQGASLANAGILATSMTEPWNGPGVGKYLFRSLYKRNSALSIRYRVIPGMTRWGMAFLRNSTTGRYREAAIDNYKLARHSVARTRELSDILSLKYDLACTGTLKVFESRKAAANQMEISKLLEPLGLKHRPLTFEELVVKEPALQEAGDRIACGVFYPDDMVGDAYKFCSDLAVHAQNIGGQIETASRVKKILTQGKKVVGVLTDSGTLQGRHVVIAAGDSSATITRPVGVRLPIRPAKGYSLTLDTAGWKQSPRIPVVDDAMHAAFSPIGDRIRLVGGAEFAGNDCSVSSNRTDELFRQFGNLYPQLSKSVDLESAQTWAGLRPMSSDGRPFIGAAGPDGLWVNSGHGHLGWTMALGSAELLVDLMLDQQTAIDPRPFRVER